MRVFLLMSLLIGQAFLIMGCPPAPGGNTNTNSANTNANQSNANTTQSDVQPSTSDIQICVKNEVVGHTLECTIRCRYSVASADVTTEVSVPSGQTRYVVCRCSPTSQATITTLSFAEAQLVSNTRRADTFALANRSVTVSAANDCGKQYQFTVSGEAASATIVDTSGAQTTLPGNQVVRRP